MKLSRFVRKFFPIIIEKVLFFRPKISLFTPWKIIAFSIMIGVIYFNFSYQNSSKVLGLTKNQNLEINSEEKIHEEILSWKSVVEKFPNYRDAYLKLAALFWKVRLDDQAKFYLEKAKELDPNNETVKKLEYVFSN